MGAGGCSANVDRAKAQLTTGCASVEARCLTYRTRRANDRSWHRRDLQATPSFGKGSLTKAIESQVISWQDAALGMAGVIGGCGAVFHRVLIQRLMVRPLKTVFLADKRFTAPIRRLVPGLLHSCELCIEIGQYNGGRRMF